MRLCSIQNFSALENVLRTGAMAMLCTTETQIEEIWKKEKQRRKPKQKEISKSTNTQKSQYNATMPLYDSRSIAEISFLRRLTTFQSPVGLFELELCSTGTSVSFSSSLAGFAALCKLRYGPTLDCEVKGGPWPLASRCRGNGHWKCTHRVVLMLQA